MREVESVLSSSRLLSVESLNWRRTIEAMGDGGKHRRPQLLK
jgi:hypothetical protein